MSLAGVALTVAVNAYVQSRRGRDDYLSTATKTAFDDGAHIREELRKELDRRNAEIDRLQKQNDELLRDAREMRALFKSLYGPCIEGTTDGNS